MKTTLSTGLALMLASATWVGAQTRQPVIVGGAAPAGAVQQVMLDASGNVLVFYSGRTAPVMLPGYLPHSMFTDPVSGEIHVVWPGLPTVSGPVSPTVVNPVPPVVVAPPQPPPAPPVVVTPPVSSNQPLNRVFITTDGSWGVYWGNAR